MLDDIGATQGELSAASRGLTMKLRENEDGLNAMGLRDLFMNNQPVLMEAIRNAYRNGHK